MTDLATEEVSDLFIISVEVKGMMESKTDHDYNCNVETAEAVASLYQLVLREQQVERELTDLERDIYLTEGDYLAETAADGNIVRGWEVGHTQVNCRDKVDFQEKRSVNSSFFIGRDC